MALLARAAAATHPLDLLAAWSVCLLKPLIQPKKPRAPVRAAGAAAFLLRLVEVFKAVRWKRPTALQMLQVQIQTQVGAHLARKRGAQQLQGVGERLCQFRVCVLQI